MNMTMDGPVWSAETMELAPEWKNGLQLGYWLLKGHSRTARIRGPKRAAFLYFLSFY